MKKTGGSALIALGLLLVAAALLLGAPGERTFYRVKVPNPPGSGKG